MDNFDLITKEELQELANKYSIVRISKMFNCSYDKVRWKCLKYKIQLPVSGHWVKQYSLDKFPSVEEMAKLVWEKPLVHIVRQFKITFTNLVKFCKDNNIKVPHSKYWKARDQSKYPTPESYNKTINPRRKTHRYFTFYDCSHPLSSKDGTVLYHRHVASVKIGRWLVKGEEVHHIDHDPSNNHPSNLEVMSIRDHALLHHPLNPKQCKICKNYFERKSSSDKRSFCSDVCKLESMKQIKLRRKNKNV